jgi:hypothetical protein
MPSMLRVVILASLCILVSAGCSNKSTPPITGASYEEHVYVTDSTSALIMYSNFGSDTTVFLFGRRDANGRPETLESCVLQTKDDSVGTTIDFDEEGRFSAVTQSDGSSLTFDYSDPGLVQCELVIADPPTKVSLSIDTLGILLAQVSILPGVPVQTNSLDSRARDLTRLASPPLERCIRLFCGGQPIPAKVRGSFVADESVNYSQQLHFRPHGTSFRRYGNALSAEYTFETHLFDHIADPVLVREACEAFNREVLWPLCGLNDFEKSQLISGALKGFLLSLKMLNIQTSIVTSLIGVLGLPVWERYCTVGCDKWKKLIGNVTEPTNGYIWVSAELTSKRSKKATFPLNREQTTYDLDFSDDGLPPALDVSADQGGTARNGVRFRGIVSCFDNFNSVEIEIYAPSLLRDNQEEDPVHMYVSAHPNAEGGFKDWTMESVVPCVLYEWKASYTPQGQSAAVVDEGSIMVSTGDGLRYEVNPNGITDGQLVFGGAPITYYQASYRIYTPSAVKLYDYYMSSNDAALGPISLSLPSGYATPSKEPVFWCTDFGPAATITVRGIESVRVKKDEEDEPPYSIHECHGEVTFKVYPTEKDYVVEGWFQSEDEWAVNDQVFHMVASRHALSTKQLQFYFGF